MGSSRESPVRNKAVDASGSSSAETPCRRSISEPPPLLRSNTANYPLSFVLSQHHCLAACEENPQPTVMPPPMGTLMGAMGERCVVCFVGERGILKQFAAERLARYLQFFHGARVRLFDAAGERELEASIRDYLDERDETAEAQVRESIDVEGLKWRVDVGAIAIVYASKVEDTVWTAATREKRAAIATLNLSNKLLFVELRTTDASKEPVDPAESLDEVNLRWCRIENFGETVTTHRVRDVLLLHIVRYLTHIHPQKRILYLSRHGQSKYNQLKKIGGNPGLTDVGNCYAQWLGTFAASHICKDDFGNDTAARLWTSTMRRTIETASYIPHPRLGDWIQMQHRASRNLDELFAGDCEGKTYDDIAAQFEDETHLRKIDKLGYRYPRGESYLDLIARLDPVLHELESYHQPTLIISHQATLRVVYAYLTGEKRAEAPKLAIPLHTLIKLTWDPWASLPTETRFQFAHDECHDSTTLDDGQRHF